ncbi:MAG: hypothetical protein KDD44_08675, partial [Bdellovibrionales bacterium]|nr:hypothetical protein [Bdellovibrionales bacterium]
MRCRLWVLVRIGFFQIGLLAVGSVAATADYIGCLSELQDVPSRGSGVSDGEPRFKNSTNRCLIASDLNGGFSRRWKVQKDIREWHRQYGDRSKWRGKTFDELVEQRLVDCMRALDYFDEAGGTRIDAGFDDALRFCNERIFDEVLQVRTVPFRPSNTQAVQKIFTQIGLQERFECQVMIHI